jgi:hypothetical protein
MEDNKQQEATGREEVQDPKQKIKQLLEGNRNLANIEIQQILKKYDCSITATMTVTTAGCYPNIMIMNNQASE